MTISTRALDQNVTANPCQIAIAYVVIDCVLLAIGAVGLRAGLSPQVAEAVAMDILPAVEEIEPLIAHMNQPGAGNVVRANGVLNILKVLYKYNILSVVYHEITNTLTWWQFLLYGIGGLATLVSAVASDGVALVAEVVVLLTTFGFLVGDSIAAAKACNLSTVGVGAVMDEDVQASLSDPLPYLPHVALRTVNGYYLSFSLNGGLAPPAGCAVATNQTEVGPNEKFTIVPISEDQLTIAFMTPSGNYLQAFFGGGNGGNWSTEPVMTNAQVIGPWETLVMVEQTDGTFAIGSKSNGNMFYLTAINGGGIGPRDTHPQNLQTNSNTIGAWETFSIVNLGVDGADLGPPNTICWNLENLTSTGAISTSVAASNSGTLSARLSQTGGGPAEVFGDTVFLTRVFGANNNYPFITLQADQPFKFTSLTFAHYHNHNFPFTQPGYQVDVQLDSGQGFNSMVSPFMASSDTHGDLVTLDMGFEMPAGTYTLRWVPLNIDNTNSDYFAENRIVLRC